MKIIITYVIITLTLIYFTTYSTEECWATVRNVDRIYWFLRLTIIIMMIIINNNNNKYEVEN